jgi:hypothetical protein
LVAGVIAAAVAWDMMLAHWGAFGTDHYKELELMPTIFVVCVMAVGYSLAFATAVLTRQMLASTVVAALALLVWAIAPLLSSHLARFAGLDSFLPYGPYGSSPMIRPFVFVSVLGLIVCVAASLFYSTRERVIRLGNKQLAWTIGLVILTLFGVTMTEVGNSLQVRDQVELVASTSSDSENMRMLQRGDHFFVSYYDHGHEGRWSMTTFRVADNGRIQDLRRASVPGMMPQTLRNGEQLIDNLTRFAFDKNDHLVVSGKRMRARRFGRSDNDDFENLWRITLTWPDGGEPKVLSRAELTLPANKRLRNIMPEYQDNVSPCRYAYLISEVGEDRSAHKDKLYVFDWSEGSNPGPRFEIPLPEDVGHVYLSRGKLYVSARRTNPKDRFRQVTFDAEHPESLLDKQNWSFRIPTDEYEWVWQFERPGGLAIREDRHGDVAYLSDMLGLRVAQQTQAGRWEIVGECRTSPLAMLFRLIPQPKVFDDSLLIERGFRGIIAYDVSNPSKPRRVGFFNAILPSWWEEVPVLTTERHLVLREFNLITVLERPDQRGKNNP